MKRDAILAAARVAFADTGFDGSSLRGIARSAGVDPALLLYFFESKAGLYRAALDVQFGFLRDLGHAVAEDRATAVAAWTRVLRQCSSGPDAPACHALLRSVGTLEASELSGEVITRVIAAVTGGTQPGDTSAEVRVAYGLSQLFGWLLLHDLVCVPALARQPIEAAAALVSASSVQTQGCQDEPL